MKIIKIFYSILFISFFIACGNNMRGKNVASDYVKEADSLVTDSLAQSPVANSEEDSVHYNPYYTPFLVDFKEYFAKNNRYKNWKEEEKKMVILKGIVEKDGSLSTLNIFRSCGIIELDNEAYRLILEAKIDPGRNAGGEPIRCMCTFAIRFPSQ